MEDPYLRERKQDVVQVVERVLAAMLGTGHAPAGALARGGPDRGGARPVARGHDPVQAAPLRRLRHRPRRRDLAHRDPRAQPRPARDRRPAPRARHDPRGRAADRRRPRRRADRQPRRAGARGVPRAQPARSRPSARSSSACAPRARRRSTASRSSSRPTSSCRRTSRRPPRRARWASACSAASSCSSTATTCLPRTSSSRPTARSPTRCTAGRSRSARSTWAPTRASTAPTAAAPNPALGLRAIRFCLAEPQMFLTQLRAILRASRHGKIRLLIPMLAHAHEVEQMLAAVRQAKEMLDDQKITLRPPHPDRRHDRGARRGAVAAVFPREARFPVDRHQRPDPVHARDRPHRRHGGAPLRSAAPGGAAADRADHPEREARQDPGRGVRRDGRRHPR